MNQKKIGHYFSLDLTFVFRKGSKPLSRACRSFPLFLDTRFRSGALFFFVSSVYRARGKKHHERGGGDSGSDSSCSRRCRRRRCFDAAGPGPSPEALPLPGRRPWPAVRSHADGDHGTRREPGLCQARAVRYEEFEWRRRAIGVFFYWDRRRPRLLSLTPSAALSTNDKLDPTRPPRH